MVMVLVMTYADYSALSFVPTSAVFSPPSFTTLKEPVSTGSFAKHSSLIYRSPAIIIQSSLFFESFPLTVLIGLVSKADIQILVILCWYNTPGHRCFTSTFLSLLTFSRLVDCHCKVLGLCSRIRET